jgi:TolB protein
VAFLTLATALAACSDDSTSLSVPNLSPSFGKGAPKPAVDKIVFAKGDSNGNAAIYTVKPDGTGLTQLTTGPYDYAPDWSPNHKKIVYYRFGGNAPSPDKRIVLMNASGTGQVEIALG